MIVVVGLPAWAGAPDGEGSAGGLAVAVAAAARAAGAVVELAGKVGDDGAGDAVVVSLGRLGIGHAALQRDPAHPTPVLAEPAEPGAVGQSGAGIDAAADASLGAADPGAGPATVDAIATLLPADPVQRPALEAADVDLALSYLPAAAVVVLADALPDAAVETAARAATFAGARLIVLVGAGASVPEGAAEAIVLETPDRDDGSFGRLVGSFAAALEAGREPGAAFRDVVESNGWQRIGS